MGSIPATRSEVRRPIARSIFPPFGFICSLFWTYTNLQAQVTPDFSRPFEQGQVVEMPGTAGYLGDIPFEIKVIPDPSEFHSLSGLLAEQVGWPSPVAPASLGLNNGSPAVLFEGIPYPFPSSSLLGWMPANGVLELLNFPASAWWGFGSANGAIQVQAPVATDKPNGNLSLWGGSGGMGGGEALYQDQIMSLRGEAQHGFLKETGPSDTFNLISKVTWLKDDALKLESGFLGTQRFTSDYWYSFFTRIQLDSANFQSLELKPFFQSAQLSGQNLQEIGSYLQYHFNMAGLAESHFGIGLSHDDFSPALNMKNFNKGFFQNTEAVDVLGFGTLQMAFRLDFSSVATTSFSTLLGAQGNLGDFLILGGYAKGVAEPLSEDTQEGELGFRYQPTDDWSVTCKYIHEQTGTNPWDGGRFTIQWKHEPTALLVFKKINLKVEEQFLQNQAGQALFDTGGRLQWSFFEQNTFWLQGRGVSNQPFYTEMGMDYLLDHHVKFYVSAANIDNLPVSWPDPTVLAGRVFWFGVEYLF